MEEDVEERSTTPPGVRRDEDIALDLMKFVAVTTGYGGRVQPLRDFSPPVIPKLRTMRGICSSFTGNALPPCKPRNSVGMSPQKP